MADKKFPKRSIKPNFDRPGEIYFIRGEDILTGAASPYVKIGLVGDKKETDVENSSQDQGDFAEEVADDAGVLAEVLENEPEPGEQDSDLHSVKELIARNSLNRLKEHQTGNPQKLVLTDARIIPAAAVSALEKTMHHTFATKRIRGEWFAIETDSELDAIIEKCRALDSEMRDNRANILLAKSLASIVTSEEKKKPSSAAEDQAEMWRSVTARIQARQREMASIALRIGKEMESVGEIDGIAAWTYSKPYRRLSDSLIKDKHPQLIEHAMVDYVYRQSFTVVNKPKADTPDPDMTMAFAETVEMLQLVKKPTIDLTQLHIRYLHLLEESEALEWERYYLQSALKSECGEASGLEGVCNWRGEVKSKFSQKQLKQYLQEKNELEILEDCFKEYGENFSFKLLPMRPYPL